MTWKVEDVDDLRRILLRSKATAMSERNDLRRLYGAYGDRRDAMTGRLADSERIIEIADRLLLLTETLRPAKIGTCPNCKVVEGHEDWCGYF